MRINSKDSVRDSILTSITNGFQQAGISNPNTSKASHFYLTADAFATTLTSIQNDINQDLIKLDPTTITGKDLDQYAATLKLANGESIVRKQPSKSSGFVLFKKTNASQKTYIDQTYNLVDASGRLYQPLASGYYADNDLLQIVSASTGTNTSIPIGTALVWRQLPLYALQTVYTTTNIAGGSDTETDEDLRQRVLNAKIYAPAGSSQDVVNFLQNGVKLCDGVYVYPTANGPASCHIALSAPPSVSLNRSRLCPAPSLTQAVQLISSSYPQTADFVVQSVVDNRLDMVFQIDSNTFVDDYALPVFNSNPTISYISSDKTQIRFISSIDFTNYATPGNCSISISWISPVDYTIVNTTIISYVQSGTVGNYTINATLSKPLRTARDSAVASSYIFPTLSNGPELLKSVLEDFAKLGAGEKYSQSSLFYTARSKRYPFQNIKNDSKITYSFINNLVLNTGIKSANIVYMYDYVRSESVTVGTEPEAVIDNNTILQGPYIYKPAEIAFFNIQSLT